MMNRELAKRAVACKHWHWIAGMRTTDGDRMSDDGWPKYDTVDVGSSAVSETIEWSENPNDNALPDLDDAATLGCLLALVRLAQGDCTIWTMEDVDCDEGTWLCTGLKVGEIGSGYCEAHALVAALEAAP